MKKLVLLAVTLVMVLSLCLPAGAEPAAEVTKLRQHRPAVQAEHY
jgi:hypothetical protein